MVNDKYLREGTTNFKDSPNPNITLMTDNGIRVTILLPDKIQDAVKQRKINRIYDILNANNPC